MEMMLWALGSGHSDPRVKGIVGLCGKWHKLGATRGWRIRLAVAVVRKDGHGNIPFSVWFG